MRKVSLSLRFATVVAAAFLLTPCLVLPARAQAKVPPKNPAKPAKKPATKAVTPKPAPAKTESMPEKPAENAASNTTVWALLVGVSKYQNPQVVSLRYPAADAASISEALTDKDLGSVPADHVRLLTDENATAANIIGAVDTFLKPNVKPGDRVLLFLAGHGVAKGVGLDAKSYLLPNDVKGLTTASLEASAVNLRTLSDKLSLLPASQFVVFVDACREDPTPGRGVKGNALSDVLSRGVQITSPDAAHPISAASFFACSIGQRAFEDPTLNHGVFTYWILEGIRTAAAARKPDGAIDMGVLSGYVRDKVSAWAKDASAKGDFEVEQTPEFVASQLNDPIILMRVKKPLPDTNLPPNAPILSILSDPPGAQITLDGERIGTAPLTRPLTKSGTHRLSISLPGYAALEREIVALDGYALQITVSPPPGARSVSPADTHDADLCRRAQEAETRQQWEVAEAGYDAMLKSDPQFVAGYERLASLRTRQGKLRPALETLTAMVARVPPTARGFGLLSTAYVDLSLAEAPPRLANAPKKKKGGGLLGGLLGKGDKKEEDFRGGPATYVVPKDWKDAAILSRRAAEDALKADANAADANRALGFALIATDSGYKNKDASLAAFGKALLFEPNDATNSYGMGYGIRFFATALKEDDARKTELERAIAAQKEAVRLRPDYYEAHRELAYCYHLIGDNANAHREYETANANRGAATNPDEVAALNLSMAGLYREDAKGANGDKKAGLEAASEGYYSDAKETSPNLDAAMRILNRAQLSTRLVDYLPVELQRFLDLPNELRSRLNLPDLPSIPGFPR